MSKRLKAIHARIAFGAVILLIAMACWFYWTTLGAR